jgi:putative Mg2+ transporter-C (MgtC) family protein
LINQALLNEPGLTMSSLIAAYWSPAELVTNGLILLNLAGALLLGLMVGYERSYHGRAAGMRTYGLVCMASAGLTIIAGYPNYWYGGHGAATALVDPTRVIQGVVTGIGFLGAGVIMRSGFTISGLTTAASIWASSVIGIMVGVGFYLAAMGLAFFSAMIMIYLNRAVGMLPSRRAVQVDIAPRRARARLRDRRRLAHHRQRKECPGMALRRAGAGRPERGAAVVAGRRAVVGRRRGRLLAVARP